MPTAGFCCQQHSSMSPIYDDNSLFTMEEEDAILVLLAESLQGDSNFRDLLSLQEAHRNAGQHSESRLRQSSDLVKPPNQQPKNVKSTSIYIYRSEYFISRKICQKAIFCHVGRHFAIAKNAGHEQKCSL
jgi:hypothetical protein